MAEAGKRSAFGRSDQAANSEKAEERRQLAESLERTKVLIHQAYAGFNCAVDPDLIESCVYEINALQARYSYLLRKIKELDGMGPAPDGKLPPVLTEAAEPMQGR
jgi:hypothetical protein